MASGLLSGDSFPWPLCVHVRGVLVILQPRGEREAQLDKLATSPLLGNSEFQIRPTLATPVVKDKDWL